MTVPTRRMEQAKFEGKKRDQQIQEFDNAQLSRDVALTAWREKREEPKTRLQMFKNKGYTEGNREPLLAREVSRLQDSGAVSTYLSMRD